MTCCAQEPLLYFKGQCHTCSANVNMYMLAWTVILLYMKGFKNNFAQSFFFAHKEDVVMVPLAV